MIRTIIFLLIVLSSTCHANSTIYFNFQKLDPASRSITADSWMLVSEGRIVSVGSGAPPAELDRIFQPVHYQDMKGQYAIPGLIDTHAHVTLGALAWTKDRGKLSFGVQYDEAITALNAQALLRYGITTIRNPGGETSVNLAYESAVRSDSLMGPESLSAGLVIDHSELKGLTVSPSAEYSIEALVQEQASAGVAYVKFYQSLNKQELATGIEAARKAGVRSIVHTGSVSWTEAANLGVDSIVHLMPISPDLLGEQSRAAYLAQARPGTFPFFEWFEYVDLDGPEVTEMINAMSRNSVHLDATLVAFEAAFWGDDVRITENPYLGEVHPAMLDTWQNTFRFDLGWKEEDYLRARAIWPKVLQLTRMLHQAGIPMTVGTDLGNPWLVPGQSMHREMQLLVDAGIPPWDVLQMATVDAARILGLGDRTGQIEAGFEADVVFLSGNPSTDISHLSAITTVLNNGESPSSFNLSQIDHH
jgi:imidazolonepropionase-like amidohydrolase